MDHTHILYDFNWFPFAFLLPLDRCCKPCNWQLWRSRNFGRRSERCTRRCEVDRSITRRRVCRVFLLLLLVDVGWTSVFSITFRKTRSISIQLVSESTWYENDTTFYAQGPAAPAVGIRGSFDPRLGTKAAKAWYVIYILVEAARWCYMTHQGWDCWCR